MVGSLASDAEASVRVGGHQRYLVNDLEKARRTRGSPRPCDPASGGTRIVFDVLALERTFDVVRGLAVLDQPINMRCRSSRVGCATNSDRPGRHASEQRLGAD